MGDPLDPLFAKDICGIAVFFKELTQYGTRLVLLPEEFFKLFGEG